MKKFCVTLLILITISFCKLFSTVIYTDVSPDSTVDDPMGSAFIDFDRDGKKEIEIRNFWIGNSHSSVELYIQSHAEALSDDASSNYYPWQIDEEFLIDNLCSKWHRRQVGMTYLKNFYNEGDKYLGIRFKINGQWHYAWLKINVVYIFEDSLLYHTILGYAYESEPDKGIVTGDIGTGDVYDEIAGSVDNAYPNPCNDRVYVKCAAGFNYVVYDFQGKKVKTGYSIDSSVDMTGLNAGIYNLQISKGVAVNHFIIMVNK